jgi:hypothetical protein
MTVVGCRAAAPSSPPTGSASPGASASDAAGSGAAGSPSAGGASPATGAEVWLPEWADENVPDVVANRPPLPFCGLEKAPMPQPGEFIDRSVRLCFWNAHLGHTPAEFASVQTTMEGAPFAVIYRLAADGTVEVFTDFTQDPFGGNSWQASACERVVEGEGDALLGVADCTAGEPIE